MNRRGFFGALVGGIAAATGVRRLASLRRAGFGSDLRVLPSGYVFTTWDQLRRDLGMAPGPHFAFKPDFSVGRSAPGICEQKGLVEGIPEDTSPGDVCPQVAGDDLGGLDRGTDALWHLKQRAERDGDCAVAVSECGRALEIDDWRVWPVDDRHGGIGFVGHRTTPIPRGSAMMNPSRPSLSDSISGCNRPAIDAGQDLPEVWPGHSGAIAATAGLPPLDQYNALVELFGKSGEASPSFAFALIGELVLTRLRLAELRRFHAPVQAPEGIPT